MNIRKHDPMEAQSTKDATLKAMACRREGEGRAGWFTAVSVATTYLTRNLSVSKWRPGWIYTRVRCGDMILQECGVCTCPASPHYRPARKKGDKPLWIHCHASSAESGAKCRLPTDRRRHAQCLRSGNGEGLYAHDRAQLGSGARPTQLAQGTHWRRCGMTPS